MPTDGPGITPLQVHSLSDMSAETFRKKAHDLLFFTDCAQKLGAVQTTLVWKFIWLQAPLLDETALSAGKETRKTSLMKILPLLASLAETERNSRSQENALDALIRHIDYRNGKKPWLFPAPYNK